MYSHLLLCSICDRLRCKEKQDISVQTQDLQWIPTL